MPWSSHVAAGARQGAVLQRTSGSGRLKREARGLLRESEDGGAAAASPTGRLRQHAEARRRGAAPVMMEVESQGFYGIRGV